MRISNPPKCSGGNVEQQKFFKRNKAPFLQPYRRMGLFAYTGHDLKPWTEKGFSCSIFNNSKLKTQNYTFIIPKLSNFWGRNVLRSWCIRVRKNRRHTRGYVEDFCELLMRKRLVQIKSKIAQFRLYQHGSNAVCKQHSLAGKRASVFS